MKDVRKLSDDVTIGPQPSLEELKQLKAEGFVSIVNFREDGEADQPLPPHEEGERVRALGLEYLHVPVSMKSMKPEVVGQFRKRYALLSKPVYAHCKGGTRAGAMVIMHLACEQGWSGEDTLRKAEQMGFQCDKPELKQLVKNYVNNHREISTSEI